MFSMQLSTFLRFETQVLLFSTTCKWWVSKKQPPLLVLAQREPSSHQLKRCLETKNVLYLLGKRREIFRWSSLLVAGMCLCSTLQSAPLSETKNSLFFCNMAICQVRSAWVRQTSEHQSLWFRQKNQHTAVFPTPVVTPSILLAPDAEISLHQGEKQEPPDFSGWLTEPQSTPQLY